MGVGEIPESGAYLPKVGQKAGQIPLLRKAGAYHNRADGFFCQVSHHAADIIPKVFSHQDPLPLGVDDLSLFVHDIVVFQDIFSDGEVLAFHPLLSIFNGAGQHAGLNGLIFSDSQTAYDGLDPFSAKEAHQFIFQRQVELGGTRVSLTSGTASQLIINTP